MASLDDAPSTALGTTDDSLLREVARAPSLDLDDDLQLASGDLVADNFRIQHKLGDGGMGVVYLADDLQLSRPVALKVHRRGSGSEATERMLREARAVASVQHENVVAVHQVGTLGGRVFIAMEFIAGGTLRSWLADQPRSPKDIVALYLQAGRGLAAAHTAGLVHRDFKPDNVLVTRDGLAKVADFGLAVFAQDSLATTDDERTISASVAHSRLTRTGAVAGTPAYMAPEQFAGAEVSPAADQFSFCVSLWEALCGERPFAGPSMGELILQVERGEIARPPPGLSRLTAILRRGLSPEPRDRFPDMDSLLAALAHDPWRRARSVGLGAGALGIAAAGLAFGQLDHQDPCPASPTPIDERWDDVRRDAVRAALAGEPSLRADAYDSLIGPALDDHATRWSSAWVDACEATKVRGEQSDTLWERRMACLDRDRSDFDAIVDILADGGEGTRRAVDVVQGLGDLQPCNDADILLAQVAPPAPALEDAVAEADAMISHAKALALAGQVREAVDASLAATAAAERVDYLPVQVRARDHLSSDLETAGRTEEAAEHAEFAWTKSIELSDPQLVIRAGIKYASLLAVRLGRQGEGARVLRDTSAWVRRSGTAVDRAQVAWVEAIIAMQAGQQAKARALMEEALALAIEAHGATSLELWGYYANLGSIALTESRFEDSLALSRKAEALLVRYHGEDHPNVWSTRARIAAALARLGRKDEAQALHEATLARMEERLGPRHYTVLEARRNLGQLFANAHDYERAVEVFDQVLAVADDKARRETLEPKATSLMMLGRYDEALPLFEEVIALEEKKEGPRGAGLIVPLANYAELLSKTDHVDEALANQRRAIDIALEQAPGGPLLSALMTNEVVFLVAGDRYAEALVAAEAARDYNRDNAARPDAEAELLRMLAGSHEALGHHTAAVKTAEEALAAAKALRDDTLIAWAEFRLAEIVYADDAARANALANEARAHAPKGELTKKIDSWKAAHASG